MVVKRKVYRRKDIKHLVITFYQKVRIHEVLGPIFNQVVSDWEAHFELLTDFWDTQLFLKLKYQGNPVSPHQAVDDKLGNSVTSEHFRMWLNP